MPDVTITRRSLVAGQAAIALYAQQVALPRKIRVAIIGLDGHPGEIGGPLGRLPGVEVVAISDATEEAIRRFTKGKPQMANARPYADFRRMLDMEKPDVVAVCNTNGARAAGVLAAAERKLHVIAEKPLATTRADMARIKKAVRDNDVKIGMLLPMRYSPAYRAVQQIVAAGDIGEAIQISSQKSYKLGKRPEWFTKRETYGSTILWIGIHMIDLMLWASGRNFTEATSFMGRVGFPGLGDMETTTTTSFQLDNKGTATLHMDYCQPPTALAHGDDRLRLAGTKGVVEYMAATGVTYVTDRSKPAKVTTLPQGGSVFVDFLDHVYNGKPASLTAEEIYAACDATIAAHEAAMQRAVVKI
jgi:predicted dehydrogenase